MATRHPAIIAVVVAMIPLIGAVDLFPALVGGVFGLVGTLCRKPGRGLAIADLLLCMVEGFMAGLNLKATDTTVTELAKTVNRKEVHELHELTLLGVYVDGFDY